MGEFDAFGVDEIMGLIAGVKEGGGKGFVTASCGLLGSRFQAIFDTQLAAVRRFGMGEHEREPRFDIPGLIVIDHGEVEVGCAEGSAFAAAQVFTQRVDIGVVKKADHLMGFEMLKGHDGAGSAANVEEELHIMFRF